MLKVTLSAIFCFFTLPATHAQSYSVQDVATLRSKTTDITTRLTENLHALTRSELVFAYNHLSGVSDAAARQELRPLIMRAMQSEGLLEPFAAILDTSVELTDTGSGNVPSAKNSLEPQAKNLIRFESEHFGSSHSIDFSFGGQFGYAPILTLVDLTKSGTALPPAARPLFQQGFTYSLRPQINLHPFSFDHGEFAAFGEFGENILTSNVSSFKQADDTIIATTVSNNVGNGAGYWETGLNFRLYNTDLTTVHRDKSYLTPSFMFEIGTRSDSRFNKAGELASYNSPEERWFYRFLISLNKVVRSRTSTDPSEPFSVDFGVDREMPLHETLVPAATRIVIKGSLDVIKLLKPQ